MLKLVRIAVGMAACLSACSPPPTALQSDRDEITLRWNKESDGFRDAQQTAMSHCASLGKETTLAAEWTDQDVKIARFRCR